MRQFLRSKPQRFRVVVPVNGLHVEGLPTKVSRVEFAVFDETHINLFRQSASQLPDERKQETLKLMEEEFDQEALRDRTVAIIEVDALDWARRVCSQFERSGSRWT